MREDVEGDHKKRHTTQTMIITSILTKPVKRELKMPKMMYDLAAGLFENMIAVENDNSC